MSSKISGLTLGTATTGDEVYVNRAGSDFRVTVEGIAALAAAETLPASIVDAKGDLIAASAADTPVRVAVGSNRQHLVADSTQTAGLKWEYPTESMIIACSDETTALTVGTSKVTFRMPYAFTLTAVRSSVTTAPTGADLVVDINESGASILSTKLSIDAGEKTSTTANTAAVISDSSLADAAEMTIDIDQIGSTIAGAGLKVYLIGYRS